MSTDLSTEFGSMPPGFGGPPGQQGGANINVKRMLLLRGPLMLGVALALAVPAVLAGWFLAPREYRATVTLQFAVVRPQLVYGTQRDRGVPYERFVSTQVSLIQGSAILSRVLEDPEVREMQLFAESENPLGLLLGMVTARTDRNSELVEIAVRAPNPDTARTVLAKTLDTYMNYALGQEAEAGGEILRLLRRERDTRQRELDFMREQIVELQRSLEMPVASLAQLGPNTTEAYRTTLARAEEDMANTQHRIARIEALKAELGEIEERHRANPGEPIYEFGIEDGVAASAQVQAVRGRLTATETELSVLRGDLIETSPRLKAMHDRARTLQQELAKAEADARARLIRTQEARLDLEAREELVRLEEATARKERFDGLIQEHDDRAMAAGETLAELDEMKMRATETRNVLSDIRQQITALSLESNAPARVQRVSDIVAPSQPDRRRQTQRAALGFMFAVGMGVLAGFLREVTDQHAHSAQDISTTVKLPVLAAVPHISSDRFVGNIYAPLLSADFPHSPTADEFRRILTRLIYPPDSSVEVNSCLVTSPTRGDGKTSVACNLAISLAKADRRVLLVDICPRDPSIEWSFGLEPGEGLAETLSGDAPLEALAQPTEFPNLKVLGPGLQADDLAGKLASREMVDFLHFAEQSFEHIIIDTPPSLLMSDAKLLAPIVDGVLVVAGASVSTKGMIRRCVREMEQVGANIVGLVLNGIKPTRGGYLRANLDLYYGYSKKRGNGRVAAPLDAAHGPVEDEDAVPMALIVPEADEEGSES